MAQERTPQDGDSPLGLGFALAAYLMWGFLPLYMKLLAHIPPTEVVAHRVLWSIPLAGALLLITRRTRDLRQALSTPATLGMAAVTAVLIAVNWGIYVWAITSGHALDAALGYYINPLFSVFLGAVVLGERLSRVQWLAVGLAALAVVVLTADAGRLPVAALGLTFSWGLYAFFKKSLPIGPNQAFMLEVLLLSPFALGFVVWLGVTGQGAFLANGWDTTLLLGAGVVTAVPLITYANGAKLLRLTTIAILQYLVPTMIFLLAVFVFREPMGTARMVAFPMIWAALVLYTGALLRQRRRR
jgi:chloramphenicol-sensitive protein RarD